MRSPRTPMVALVIAVPTLACLLSAVKAQEQQSEKSLQLKGPTILELADQQSGLTYDALVKELSLQKSPTQLSFDPTKARYFDLIQRELEMTKEEVQIFRKRGFVAMDHQRAYTFTRAYYDIYSTELPVLITTDSILHAIHHSYDEILQEVELRWLRTAMAEVLTELHIALENAGRRNQDNRLVPIYRDVDLYLTVARNLIAPEEEIEKGGARVSSVFDCDAQVAEILQKIQELKIHSPRTDPPFKIYGGKRYIDFSQFAPRGHYLNHPELAKYFRCVMWLSRADTGWNVLPTDAIPGIESDSERELRDAVLFTQLLMKTGNLERLRAMDRVISTFVGTSDSLNPSVLARLMKRLGIREVDDVAEGASVLALQNAIRKTNAGRQLIRSQVVISNPKDAYRVSPPSLFQPFGQRFILDSYALSHVVFDSIVHQGMKPRRMMPSGLDMMALLGNDVAVPLLESEIKKWHYAPNLQAGRQFIQQQPDSYWDSNIYSGWLNCIRALNRPFPKEAHAPQVMQTDAWKMKQMQTQLASWAQLRRDTILYSKQSFTAVPGCEYLDGYVEPYPEFFAAVARLANTAARLLQVTEYRAENEIAAAMLSDVRARHLSYFNNLAGIAKRLEKLARKELAAEPFTTEEKNFVSRAINAKGRVPFGSGSQTSYSGWYCGLMYGTGTNPDSNWKPTIADVHTDPESKRVLHVGVGQLNLCVVAVDNAGDRTCYVGPIFSYYEFPLQGKRLNDGQWNAKLNGLPEGYSPLGLSGRRKPSVEKPSRPRWVKSFVATPKARIPKRNLVQILRSGDSLYVIKNNYDSEQVVRLTDAGLKKLSGLTSIRALDLGRTRISDEGLKALSGLKNLRNVSLASTRVAGSGLVHFKDADYLRYLSLRNTDVASKGLEHLVSLKSLERLNLSGTRIDDGAVASLKKMPGLIWLDVRRTRLTADGIKQLRKALPKADLVVD